MKGKSRLVLKVATSRLLLLLGGIQQLRGHNFAIFDPPPLHGRFLYPERGQKQTFFDPFPLILYT